MSYTTAPSPNRDAREAPISLIVLHYTGMESGAAALDRLTDKVSRVSAHYLVEEDGEIFHLVPEAERAWHAGVASWGGETRVNAISIGVEIVNGGHDFGLPPYPDRQIESVIELVKAIMARHAIPPHRVVGHSDVAPERKLDPGEHFPWARLAEAGCAIWPEPAAGRVRIAEPGERGKDVARLQAGLAVIGYGLVADGVFGPRTEAVVRAFQRRFRPDLVDGAADEETLILVERVAELSAG